MKYLISILIFFASLPLLAQVEDQVPARPDPPTLVNDYTNTLTPQQKQALESKLVAFDDSTTTQIAIVIVATTDGYSVASYANALYRKWGLGSKENDNGVLILVAKDDRKMHIEVGYGLEGAVTDYTAKSIIDNSLTPQFRAENYYRGLDLATDDLIAAAGGEYQAPEGYGERNDGRGGGIGFGTIILLLLLFLFLGGMGGRGRGGRGGDGGMMTAAGWIIGSMLGGGSHRGGGWSGGGGGWSGGGGGFGGFGGGSSGGGGASGSW